MSLDSAPVTPATPESSEAPLTPSEVVLLRGAEFASRARLGQSLLGAEGKVNATEWMRAAYLAAAVANLRAGTIRLEHTTRKTFFKLFTAHDLMVSAGATPRAWPSGTLEARVVAAVASKPVEATDLYAWLIGQDSTDVPALALSLLYAPLVARGLLEAHEKKTLKIFKTTEFTVPESTRALATDALAAQVKRMLAEYEAAEPELWRLLEGGLDAAISRRTESQNAGNDFSSN